MLSDIFDEVGKYIFLITKSVNDPKDSSLNKVII